MDLGLNSKKAYVTGAATGIGREVTRQLAFEGANVFAVDIDSDTLQEYIDKEGLTLVQAYKADLSTADGCAAASRAGLSHFGGAPDILVNNVGGAKILAFEDIDDATWQWTLNLNLFSLVRTCRVLLPEMAAAAGGAVVNTLSDFALQPETTGVDYAATKAAMLNLSKALSRAYGPSVRVNSVCPGPIWTPLWSKPGGIIEPVEKEYGLKGEEALTALSKARGMPLARAGRPEEVARAIVFLASSAASFITGAVLGVHGGTVRSIF